MKSKKPAITGSIDKDQLYYETSFNPESTSYIGPRVMSNQATVAASPAETEDMY